MPTLMPAAPNIERHPRKVTAVRESRLLRLGSHEEPCERLYAPAGCAVFLALGRDDCEVGEQVGDDHRLTDLTTGVRKS
jgi:hypothetical protein